MAEEFPGGGVRLSRQGAVAVLTLSYPARRNALSTGLREGLERALTQALGDDGVRVLVLTGEGGHFCSGGDISAFDGITPASGRRRMQRAHGVVRMLLRSEKPVIAAVEGHAAGAGLSVAAACDIVVASREARFSCTFNRIGLLPDLGALWTLPQRMGLGRAKFLIMTGRHLGAEEALQQGIAEMIAEPGQALAEAVAIAQDIAANAAPLSNALVKATLARGPWPLEGLLDAEADAQGVLYGTQDFQEGRQAFMEKRKPVFTAK
jgi:2-(1,2-epoxy-1,2-dihydrophenyl)acetyl-CoA isomerase